MIGPELKPCPFCGGEAKWKSGGPGCAYVVCASCPAETDDGSMPRIREAWNTRAALPEVQAIVDAAVKADREAADRYRYVLDGVKAAIDTGRNEPLQIWRDQIVIALDADAIRKRGEGEA